MKSNPTMKPDKTLRMALAGALLLGLAACDGEPQSASPRKSFDNLVENAGRQPETTPSPSASDGAVMNRPQSASPATDLVLAARVRAALSADPELRSVTVDVRSDDGVITLYGTADSPAKSRQAAMAALNVDGVRSVRNEMVIVKRS